MITVLGWVGSALFVASLAQRRQASFRVLNLLGAAVLLVFDVAINLWAMAVLNVAILVAYGYPLIQLARANRRQPGPAVIDLRDVGA